MTASVLKLNGGHELISLEDSRPAAAPSEAPGALKCALINYSDIWRLEYFSEPVALSVGTYAAKVKHPVSTNC